MDDDALYERFNEVFLDLCLTGACTYDPVILQELWLEFLQDLERGFASLFGARTDQ
jgi:hypothetical protein